MQQLKIALIGFGNVGQGFVKILAEKAETLREMKQTQLSVVAVCDLHRGSIYDPEGFAPDVLLDAVTRDGHLDKVPALHRGWDAMRTIESSNADIIAEMSFTDLETGQPALDHIRAALRAGRHVTTTNKGPVALHYPELAALAAEKGVSLGIEGTVMSGSPAIGVGMAFLQAAGIRKIEGILNGTTNYMLTEMAAGASYKDALDDAQARGFAEADPTGDVEGYDAAGKAIILANLFMGAQLQMCDVDRRGIAKLTELDMAHAAKEGKRWKLLATVEQSKKGVMASVQPIAVGEDHPLYGITGATNAITYTTDLLGEVTLVGPGAGRMETGYALVEDILQVG